MQSKFRDLTQETADATNSPENASTPSSEVAQGTDTGRGGAGTPPPKNA